MTRIRSLAGVLAGSLAVSAALLVGSAGAVGAQEAPSQATKLIGDVQRSIGELEGRCPPG